MATVIDQPLLEAGDDFKSDISEISTVADGDIEEQKIFHYQESQSSSLFDAFQLLLNTAIGSGTLMVPYCYTQGIALSALISAGFAIIGYFTLSFMAESGYFTHKYDYRGLFAHTFGQNKLWIINVMITCVQLGASMIYCHWNGRLMPKLIGTVGRKDVWGNVPFWTMIMAVCFSVPLVCLRSIHALEKIAVLSTFCIFLLIIHAVYWLIVDIKKQGFDPQHAVKWFNPNAATITSLAVSSMAYNCHLNYFPAIENMKMATVGRGRKLALITMIAAYILYNVFGLVTYLDLNSKLDRSSSLLKYDDHNVFTKITLAGIIFLLVLSVPIVVWAARNSINNLIWKDEPPTTLRWILIGTAISVCAAGLAASSENVILFFDVVGGFFTPTIIFLMPAVFYLKNERNEPKWRKGVAWFIAFFTIVAIVVILYQVGQEIYHEFKPKKK